MSSFSLEPVSLSPPSASGDGNLRVSFRLPAAAAAAGGFSAREPLGPATALQLAFANGSQQAFVERMTARDVQLSEDDEGLAWVQLPGRDVVRFAQPEGDSTTVELHAWKGEKWLGKWDVGSLAA